MRFEESEPGSPTVNMVLTLRYTLQEPAARWKIALVVSPVVQGILRSRMTAGLKRFATAMRREHGAAPEVVRGVDGVHAVEGELR